MRQSAYDDDERDFRIPQSSNRNLLIVLGIVGVVLCVCILAAGVLVYLGAQLFSSSMASMASSMATIQDEWEASEYVAERFMTDIADGRLDDAYDDTTRDFQTRQPRPQFRAFVERNPALRNYESTGLTTQNYTPSLAVYRVDVADNNGVNVSFTLRLVKDGEEWKVDRFTIP